jgi:phytoene dehydrogenase-like protein
MTSSKQIAIIGAGHNALVCACYLAKAGHEVAVYERRSRVGGAVNTEEVWPGYQVDTCRYDLLAGLGRSANRERVRAVGSGAGTNTLTITALYSRREAAGLLLQPVWLVTR